jgi:hypothetical protein
VFTRAGGQHVCDPRKEWYDLCVRFGLLISLSGDVVQLVRTLPRHSLESYTVTADSFYPALFGGFLSLLAVRSQILRCIRADLPAVFTVATV